MSDLHALLQGALDSALQSQVQQVFSVYCVEGSLEHALTGMQNAVQSWRVLSDVAAKLGDVKCQTTTATARRI